MGKTNQEIIINAGPDTVWQAIRNFHDMSWAPDVINSLEKIGDKTGEEIGSQRLLNGAFKETLVSVDEATKTFCYSIDDAPSPISPTEISNFVGQVKVELAADGEGTRVEWTTSWEKNDEPAYEFCHAIYIALLSNMKKSLE